jgi:hypothetical protein
VCADLDCVEHWVTGWLEGEGEGGEGGRTCYGEVLAVVGDDVVGGADGAHVVDYHFAWKEEIRAAKGGWKEDGGGRTCLSEGFIVEAR